VHVMRVPGLAASLGAGSTYSSGLVRRGMSLMGCVMDRPEQEDGLEAGDDERHASARDAPGRASSHPHDHASMPYDGAW